MANKLYQNILWLRKRYHVDKKTPLQIAQECGVSEKTIYSYLDRFELRRLKP
jgi:DNA-binding CsgD family transcriptional regulator